jgi:hypothetical protein
MPRVRAEAAADGLIAPGGAERLSSLKVFH